MIYFTKIEKGELIIKLVDNTNTNSMTINIGLEKNTLHTFRKFYQNINKNTNCLISLNNIKIEYNNNVITFNGKHFEYKINKSPELLDMFDKVITNLMINDLEGDSPKIGIDKLEKFEK